jgi:S-adenosylmethionine decarboxylase
MAYGKELILDLHDCDVSKFNREDIEAYLVELCDDIIDMERADLHWWDYEDPSEYDAAPSHLKGTSCVQFIMTSTITIHSLEELKKAFINIFTCKDFDADEAANFTAGYFGGNIANRAEVDRI